MQYPEFTKKTVAAIVVAVILITRFVLVNDFGSLSSKESNSYDDGLSESTKQVVVESTNSDQEAALPQPVETSTATTTKRKKKILITFLAGNHKERAEIVLKNIHALETPESFKQKYDLTCQILQHASYADAKKLGFFNQNITDKCTVVMLYGFSYTEKLAQLDSFLLKQANFNYVTVVMDDINLFVEKNSFSLERYYDLVVKHDLAISCPSVTRSYWKHMQRYGGGEPPKESSPTNCDGKQ